jgi:sigma-54 dependent transcriptional regulator, flagellar regulatory protein
MADTATAAFGSAEASGLSAAMGDTQLLPSGDSAAIRRVNHLIRQVAGFDTNVLVLGESGTGKEVVARAIHETSPRRRRPFVPINCGAIPAELLESELFGHEKGAFTGALASRKGRFEIAEGGTIFLDEIGDMNPTMQVKLLRVLQERVYERVGSCVSQRSDVRIIAATHRNLEEAIARGAFREDLYYRLNVVPIEMPPLRERTDDLPGLISALAERMAGAGRPRVCFTAAALGALTRYHWPGNVRELGNLIERMAVQCGARPVAVADLPGRYRPADWDPDNDTPPAEALIASAPASLVLASARDTWTRQRNAQAAAALSGSLPESVSAVPATGVPAAAPVSASTPTPTSASTPASGAGGAPGGEAEEEPPPMMPVLADLLLQPIPEGFDLREYLESLEQRLIERAMRAAGGTVAQAARLLGLRRTTLVEKLRKYAPGSTQLTSES